MHIILVVFLTIFSLFATAPANAADGVIHKDIAAKAESYLNKMTTFSAEFTQISPEGKIAGGQFYLKRPGKFRWEYDEREPVLIISNGKRMVYYDKELEEITYVDLKDTLAGFLARANISFEGDIKLLEAYEEQNMLKIRLTQKNKPEEGALTLIFAKSPMQLAMLEIADQYGQLTQVFFKDIEIGKSMEKDLFIFKNPKFNKNVWE